MSTLGVVAVLSMSAACGAFTESDTDEAALGSAVAAVRLAAGAGSVSIRRGEPGVVRRTVHHTGERPGETHRVEGDVLILEECPVRHCWADYEVVLPEEVDLVGEADSGDLVVDGVSSMDFRSGSGDVSVRGSTGTVNLETGSGSVSLADIGEAVHVEVGSGDVSLREVGGDVTVRSSSGDVEGSGLGGTVDVEAGSGDVAVWLATVADVRARTSSGRVELTVPRGRYRVSADVGSGDLDSAVGDDAAAGHTLDLATGSGDIRVRHP